MDVYFYRLGIFFQSIFDVNSQVTWNSKLVTCIRIDLAIQVKGPAFCFENLTSELLVWHQEMVCLKQIARDEVSYGTWNEAPWPCYVRTMLCFSHCSCSDTYNRIEGLTYIDRVWLRNLILKTSSKEPSFLNDKHSPQQGGECLEMQKFPPLPQGKTRPTFALFELPTLLWGMKALFWGIF